VQLLFRRIFSSYNEVEIDEFLHTTPVYRRPERRALQQSQQRPYSTFLSTSRNPSVRTDYKISNKLFKKKTRENIDDFENIQPNLV
jgi:hypothetical protein